MREVWAVAELAKGVLWRSLYGNLAGLGGVRWEDGKVYARHNPKVVRHILRDHAVVSSEPRPHPELIKFLRRLLVEKLQKGVWFPQAAQDESR